MGPRTIFVIAISTVAWGLSSAVVFKQCGLDRKCVPFSDCAKYRNYVGIPSRNWPSDVQHEVKSHLCEMEELASGKKLYKVCCILDMGNCGKQTTQRIAHGEIATIFQFPWMALLRGFDGKFHCGGALIAPRYVLTATHCRRKQVHSVRLGETDLSTAIDCVKFIDGEEDCADAPQDIVVEKFIGHPKYSSSQKKNDIALLKLKTSAQFNDNVQPICLPLPEIADSNLPTRMMVSGWGFTEDEMEISNKLRYAYVPIVSPRVCNESLARISNVWTVDESQICAGAGINRADNCQGDSGGPLKYAANGQYVVHGVVSFGQATCGVESEPGIYTNVRYFLDWIIDRVQ
ncbi:CLIP domain-containing serine protease HP8-like [Armigeres subalbatus]|uniref:CLIP domain-containing serine protease HP8-like n=1 Tax=Armigeres subalbatus TaxID=124917 RepID=UPI002ED23CC0